MLGTLVNVAAIFAGGLIGLIAGRNLSSANQQHVRLIFTAVTLLVAMTLTWSGLTGPWTNALKQLAIAFLALCVGSLLGRLLHFQRGLTRLARWAGRTGDVESSHPPERVSFGTQAVAFAGNPLGLAGAFVAGWTGDWRMLALKAGLDGLAAWGFAAAGSRTVLLATLPVAAVQGTLTLLGAIAAARFSDPTLAAELRISAGLFVLVMAPVIFGWRQVPLANYLPPLPLALLLAAWWN